MSRVSLAEGIVRCAVKIFQDVHCVISCIKKFQDVTWCHT